MRSEIVVGLGFGDEGKGTIVDYLARQYDGDVTVVRFNGGAQAAHNVVTPDGRHHTFAQFGSGTFAGARTHLAPGMIVNPMNMMEEARILATVSREWDAFDRLTIDPMCLVTTRFHMARNRIMEILRGGGRHGSCGQGIGATVEYALKIARRQGALRVGHLSDKEFTRQALTKMRDYYVDCVNWADADVIAETNETLAYEIDILRNLDINKAVDDYWFWTKIVRQLDTHHIDGDLIFEGAQGALLDEQFGTNPHNTWSKCRSEGAINIIRDLGRRRPTRCIGVTRTYSTRHGAGPFPTEDKRFTHPEPHNDAGLYQGGWRQGFLDVGLMNYALTFSDVTEIAVTHMDRLEVQNRICYGYKHPFDNIDLIGRNEPLWCGWHRDNFIESLSLATGKPIYLTSHGPTANDKEDRCAYMA